MLHALKNDPKKLKAAVQLSAAQLAALNSATAFPVKTRSATAVLGGKGLNPSVRKPGALHTEAFIGGYTWIPFAS